MFVPKDLHSICTPTELCSPIQASEFVRFVQGVTVSALVKCSDGHYYIIDQPGSVPTPLDLVASQLGPTIARAIGISIAYSAAVCVDAHFASRQKDRVRSGSLERILAQPGIYYANRLAGTISGYGWAIPHLSPTRWSCVINRNDFVGIRLLGNWFGCLDGQTAMFVRSEVGENLKSIFIDTNRLCTNPVLMYAPPTFNRDAASSFPYSHLWTRRSIRDWISRIAEVAPIVLEVALSEFTSTSPFFVEASRLHFALITRLEQMRLQA